MKTQQNLNNKFNITEVGTAITGSGCNIGAVALTKIDNKYLLGAWSDNDKLQSRLNLYESNYGTIESGFRLIDTIYRDNIKNLTENRKYQMINFVIQKNGCIFLIGTDNTFESIGSNYADLLQLYTKDNQAKLSRIHKLEFPKIENFDMACGIHIQSLTKMYLYNCAGYLTRKLTGCCSCSERFLEIVRYSN